MFKKLLSLLLALVMVLGMRVSVFGMETEKQNQLLSCVVEHEVTEYAERIAPLHLHSITINSISSSKNKEYSIGLPFTATDFNSKQLTYFYPIVDGQEIVLILQVNKDPNTGELSSSLSKSFSDELEQLLNDRSGKIYSLITDGNVLLATDGSSTIEMYKVYEDNKKDYSNIIAEFKNNIKGTVATVALEKSKLIQGKDTKNLTRQYRKPMGPDSYKTLNVSGVSQGNHPWCWAATCAAMINYYKGKSLSASGVANYVFPDDPEQGGNWTDMKKAYNHWGLYPSQTGKISFSSVMSKIDNDKPMHLGLTGHSVGLIGYEDWSYPDDQDILILLEPNGGVHKSVTLKSNGNFNYYLSGTDSWQKTRTF